MDKLSENSNLAETSVLCPRVQQWVKDKVDWISYALTTGAIIRIHNDHNLILCQQCWQVVRAAFFDSVIETAVKANKQR